MGTLSTQSVIIIGGGITGLAAAHHVLELAREQRRSVNLHLFEAGDRLGGTIQTRTRDGFLLEAGPDSFITEKPWALDLCKRLGLADQLIPTNPNCRRTFVVRDGCLHPVPEGFLLLAPTRMWPFVTSGLFSWSAKCRMALDLILPARKHGVDDDESLGSFVRRRFGREALEQVAQPLIGGIYTANPDELSLRATMPRFLEYENKYGSIIRAMRQRAAGFSPRGVSKERNVTISGSDSGVRYSLFVTLARGMSTLIETLASKIPAESLQLNTAVSQLKPTANGWQVLLANGTSMSADSVIAACPSRVTADLLRETNAPLADELAAIRYASSGTMVLAYRRDQIAHDLDGFGFVVPVIEKRSIISATFSSVKFAGRAPDGWVLIRAFFGGAMQPEVYERSDADLCDAVQRDLHDLIGAQGSPRWIETYRWPQSMPQYHVGHLQRVQRINNLLAAYPTLAIAGNAFGGVGIPDCIHSAELAAEDICERVS